VSWEDEARMFALNADYWRERTEKAEAEVERLREAALKDGVRLAATAAEVERLRDQAKRAYFEGFDDSWVQSRGLNAEDELIEEEWLRSIAAGESGGEEG